ncbi:hypothetical protein N7494_010084 [Penicillium frequentans]|uniref:Uncharacterized protein n=1 Tax=Penicillium frequentans TaxID=3151616 RepID=A0AAD6CR50_9EURO|nr:hypothetical protein N7494_010084 [Penicillium glabrum]
MPWTYWKHLYLPVILSIKSWLGSVADGKDITVISSDEEDSDCVYYLPRLILEKLALFFSPTNTPGPGGPAMGDGQLLQVR